MLGAARFRGSLAAASMSDSDEDAQMGKDYIESLMCAVTGAVDTVRPIRKCVPIIIAAPRSSPSRPC